MAGSNNHTSTERSQNFPWTATSNTSGIPPSSTLKSKGVLVLVFGVFFSISTLVQLVFIPDSAFLFLLGVWENRHLCSNRTAISQNRCNTCLSQRKDVQIGFLTDFVFPPPRYCSYSKALFPQTQKSLHVLQLSLHFPGH